MYNHFCATFSIALCLLNKIGSPTGLDPCPAQQVGA